MVEAPNTVDQFRRLLDIAKSYFPKERYEALEKMYEHFADRILVAPASAKAEFHSAYPGGYLDHIHNVIKAIIPVARAAKEMGMKMDFTKEEAIFAAMHHDLGKLGDLTEPYYLPQGSEWHRENRGELFVHNHKLPRMTVTDRALFLLQHFNVAITPNEWVAIKASDGLYTESNKPYFVDYTFPPRRSYTNLVHVLHWADHMASLGEQNAYREKNGSAD